METDTVDYWEPDEQEQESGAERDAPRCLGCGSRGCTDPNCGPLENVPRSLAKRLLRNISGAKGFLRTDIRSERDDSVQQAATQNLREHPACQTGCDNIDARGDGDRRNDEQNKGRHQ